jgi:hypothetical protein
MGRPLSASVEWQWRERVTAWRQSGLSARAFAQREGIGVSSLFNWARRLEMKNEAPRIIQLVPKPPHPSVRESHGITVRIGDAAIEVRQTFDRAALADIVRVLKETAT